MKIIPCEYLTPTNFYQTLLCRYDDHYTIENGELVKDKCPLNKVYHVEMNPLTGSIVNPKPEGEDFPHTDTRWPTECQCGYKFSSEDGWKVVFRRIYRDESGNFTTLHDAPIGATWVVLDWDFGIALNVKIPNNRVVNLHKAAANNGRPLKDFTKVKDLTMSGPIYPHIWLRCGKLVVLDNQKFIP